jgi:hypothetical protein
MNDQSWTALQDAFKRLADMDVKVDRLGESHKIHVRAGSTLLVVADTWWRKNLDVWTGWQVHVENADGIVTRNFPKTKKRAQVVRDVQAALDNQFAGTR